ncbi:hypothetical protein P3T76_008867 [Phytophthora citrophthora]|uniref:Uncharacterized protein n=1 Tax=Phytophthora citrophthora TaxID=4793 RepID=A0AAD9GI56_9STRA|nr:hypothetical protein P3T76_008867 [Phytophthora citrophthora]
MESSLRNALTEYRLRQHARGVLHPGNRSVLAETFEFVVVDAYCRDLFTIFQRFARRLDPARRWVRSLVELHGLRRNYLQQNRLVANGNLQGEGFLRSLDVRALYYHVLEHAASTFVRCSDHETFMVKVQFVTQNGSDKCGVNHVED